MVWWTTRCVVHPTETPTSLPIAGPTAFFRPPVRCAPGPCFGGQRVALSTLRLARVGRPGSAYSITPQATRAPPPPRGLMVGVVVAAGVHHQGAALDVRFLLQARGQHRLVGVAFSIHIQGRQVTQVAVAPGRAVLAGVLRVVMAAGGARRGGGAVHL